MLSLTLAFFLLSSSVFSFITISKGEAKASSDGGGGGGNSGSSDGGGDSGGDGGGDGGGEQQSDGSSSEDGGEKQQEDLPQEETSQDEVVTDAPLEDMMMGAMPPAPATAPSQKQQQPVLCPTASTSSLVDSGRPVFVADTTGTPQGSTGGSSSSKPADPTSSNCPTVTNQPPTTPQSLTSPTTPSSPTTTPSQSAAIPPPTEGTTTQPTTTPSPQGTTTQPAPLSSGDQPSAGNSGGEGGQVQKQKKYEPPAAALPYHGNEVELIEFYANADPTNPAILRTAKVGEDVHTTFADGTIKTSNLEGPSAIGDEELSPSDFVEGNIRITPGAGTPLDKLGVIQARVPFSYSLFGPSDDHTIKYSNGHSIERRFQYPNLKVVDVEHKDSKGNVLETTKIDYQTGTTVTEKPADGSKSTYNADGSYLTTWPKKPDGSQQFYDSKQQKIFIRDANGNIVPPKE
jgi:hypothetical protein